MADVLDRSLKKLLTSLVIDSRRGKASVSLPYNPRFVAVDDIIQPNRDKLRRLKIILMSRGCSVPTCTMCPFTNENNYGSHEDTDGLIIDQVRKILDPAGTFNDYDCVSLYNDGSFFAPSEISNDTRIAIAGIFAKSEISLMTVESLPQFITESRLASFLDKIGKVTLEVGIGLQSSNSTVREYCVNTSFDNHTFEQAVLLMQKYNVRVKTYIMLKPPFLTEEEGIADAVRSMEYCCSLGVPYVTLCPTRIAPNTLAYKLFEADAYTPPKLWSIIDTVKNSPREVSLRVACINLHDNDFASFSSGSCPKCSYAVINALEEFSLGNRNAVDLQRCSCAAKPIDIIDFPNDETLINRIRETLYRFTMKEDVLSNRKRHDDFR